jgi:hypothetical protein
MPMPVSRTGEPDARVRGRLRRHLGLEGDAAGVGELDRVADEVDQHLPDAMRVADQVVGERRRHGAGELEPLVHGARREEVGHLLQLLAEVERHPLDDHLARLDLREVEDVVDDRQEAVCRGLDRGDEVRCSSSSCDSARRSAMPMTPFIGVRISCDMLARNSDLSRDAERASSRAVASSWSRRLRSMAMPARCAATSRKPSSASAGLASAAGW